MTTLPFPSTPIYLLHQRVVVRPLDRPGIVTGVLHEDAGMSYRVAYWHDGTRRQEWLYASELMLAEPTSGSEAER